MVAAGAAAAGLAGGLVIGSRMASKRPGLRSFARALASVTEQASVTTSELRQVREHLENANRRSPLEVVLDGLTHRRGAHRREG